MAEAVYVQTGDRIDYTPGSAVAAGEVVVINGLCFVAVNDIPANTLGALYTRGVFDVALAGSLAVSVGDEVFFVEASNYVNKTESGNIFFGRAVKAAEADDPTVRVALLASESASAVPRSALVEDALQPYDVMPVLKGADGADLALTETAGDFFKNIGTNQDLIDGEATINETEASVGIFTFTLPPEYVSGGDIKIRAGAGVILAGDAALTSATIDFEAYKQATDGTVGSDLVATAATAITDTIANKDFTVTATGLVAGDKLNIKMTTSVVETAGGTGAANSRITRLQMLCDIKG